MMPKKKAPTEPSAESEGEAPFEASLERLTTIVDKLEHGDLGLEESLALFEEGVRLARVAQTRLDAAEKRVEELIAVDDNGNPVTRELEPE
jgi:exodeoxyribonuclease VII small subunit